MPEFKGILKATLDEKRKQDGRAKEWHLRCLKHEIRNLPWYSEHLLYGRFMELYDLCDAQHLDFWKLVEEVGGFFAMRILIHAIMVVSGLTQKRSNDE